MKGFGKCLFLLILMAIGTVSQAQVVDSIGKELPLQRQLDSCRQLLDSCQRDLDSLRAVVTRYENEKLLMDFNHEKDILYKAAKEKEIEYLQHNLNEKEEALKNEKENNLSLKRENQQYRSTSDSLRNSLTEAEKRIIRTNEELKYTQQRAREAEAKVNAATAKKKKVVAIQGIALKTFRTPNWSIAPDKIEDGSIAYRIVNKNGGSVEFDYTTGASVMLWDLTHKEQKPEHDSISTKYLDIKRFDQEFSYSLGLYVGFGGSNLFKNFYVGPSFKFLDFFHLTAGINICEYEMLTGNFKEGDILPAGLSLTDQISKVWKPKPFVSLSFDLDFISYIKK
ncbi:MAG: hypothetical protein IKT08_08720 [Bacteroidales bacterium]|nr:hypothetical protein [Bacteroidales bacterium]